MNKQEGAAVKEKYFDELMSSLKDTAAFAQGDTARACAETLEAVRKVRYQRRRVSWRDRQYPSRG